MHSTLFDNCSLPFILDRHAWSSGSGHWAICRSSETSENQPLVLELVAGVKKKTLDANNAFMRQALNIKTAVDAFLFSKSIQLVRLHVLMVYRV
jgi:hypothetical protein